MTRDEILAMGAGRQIDILVATHVFELVWWHRGSGSFIALPEDDTEIPSYWKREAPTLFSEDQISHQMPYYSTDIAAAWQVVEEFNDGTGHWVKVNNSVTQAGLWRCEIVPQGLRFDLADYAWADTAPLAICRAALLAKMEAES